MEKRYFIAKVIASVATVISVIGVIMKIAEVGQVADSVLGIGIFAAFIAYIFGGLLKALSKVLSIAGWGLLVGSFPYNIVCCAVSGMAAFLVMLLLPIIPVSQAAREWA